MFGPAEMGLTLEQAGQVYEKLTPTEKKYFELWTKWKSMDIPPWRLLNKKYVTRDMILMIDQFDTMYNEREKHKQHKEEVAKSANAFMGFAQQGNTRSNKTKAVL